MVTVRRISICFLKLPFVTSSLKCSLFLFILRRFIPPQSSFQLSKGQPYLDNRTACTETSCVANFSFKRAKRLVIHSDCNSSSHEVVCIFKFSACNASPRRLLIGGTSHQSDHTTKEAGTLSENIAQDIHWSLRGSYAKTLVIYALQQLKSAPETLSVERYLGTSCKFVFAIGCRAERRLLHEGWVR